MPTKEGTEYWNQVAWQCKQRPNVWHLVLADRSRSWGYQIRKGAIAALKPLDEWEVRTRKSSENGSNVWIRYTGT